MSLRNSGDSGSEAERENIPGRKNSNANPITCVECLCQQLAHETGEGDGPHSSTLAWKIPWTEEPGRQQSIGSHRVGHD